MVGGEGTFPRGASGNSRDGNGASPSQLDEVWTKTTPDIHLVVITSFDLSFCSRVDWSRYDVSIGIMEQRNEVQ
jgi:hypothetical protein